MPLPRYIQKRRKRYYAVLEIPKALRAHYSGKVRLLESLKTDSLSIAQRRANAVVASWQSEFAKLRNEGDDAAFHRHRLQRAQTEDERRVAMAAIELETENRASVSYDDHMASDPITGAAYLREQKENALAEADDFYKRATGEVTGLTDYLDDWLGRWAATDRVKDRARKVVERFAALFPTVQDVTHETVQGWVDRVGLGPKTVRNQLSILRNYWKYLQRPNVKAVPNNVQPFTDLDLPKKRNGNGKRDQRKPFEPIDVARLCMAAYNQHEDEELGDLIWLAMYTGCRIEELCSLRAKNVHLDKTANWIEITDAKTAAGWRAVPIHSNLLNTVKRLLQDAKGGYLLSGLSANKYGKRSSAIGKRFGRLKTTEGFGPDYVFHSIRKTVATMLENAGVPENVSADILGHEKPRITYGLYSGGTSLAVKAEAIEKLVYVG